MEDAPTTGDRPASGASAPWLPSALAAGITVLVALPTLVYPHGRDQGSYAYAGWRLLHGELPYRDVIAFKPPGSVFVHGASIALFGVGDVAIRAFDLLWTVGTALAIVGLTRALGGSGRASAWAGVLASVLYLQVDYWNIAQTDAWTTLPTAVALWGTVVAHRRGGAALWAGCGGLLGLAALLKYTALGAAVPLVLAAALFAREPRRDALIAGAAGAAGAAAVLGATAGALVLTGSWEAFAQIQLELVPDYVSGQRKGVGVVGSLVRAVSFTSHQVDLIPAVVAGPIGALLAWRGLPARGLAVVGAWWALGAVGVLAQGKYYDYHYLPLVGPGAILLGAGVDGLVGLLPERRRLVGTVGVAVVAGGALLVSPWSQYAREAARVARGTPRAEMWAGVRRYNYRDYDCAEVDAAGAWLAAHTGPDDPVFVWSYDPAILVRARRRQVSRFLYDYPLRVPWADPAWEREVVDALRADPPAAVVIATGDSTPGVTGHRRDSLQDLERLPALRAELESGWCEVERVGRYRMWLPRGAGC